MTQKYFIGRCGGEDCSCRIPAVYHNAIVGYTCGKDKQDCNEQRCKNCPHGKTIDEFKKDIAEVWLAMPKADNTDPKEYADTLAQNIIDKALLGRGGK